MKNKCIWVCLAFVLLLPYAFAANAPLTDLDQTPKYYPIPTDAPYPKPSPTPTPTPAPTYTPNPSPTPKCDINCLWKPPAPLLSCNEESHCVIPQIGKLPGLVEYGLSANQYAELYIVSTNSHGDTPAYKWFLFTAVIGGNALPIYLLSDIGVFDLNQVLSNLYDYTFSFKDYGLDCISNGLTTMSHLGLQAKDTLTYGYAYMTHTGKIVIDNIVTIRAQ